MKELKGKSYVYINNGKVNKDAIGWSKSVYKKCNIDYGYLRKKIWNRYLFISDKFIIIYAIMKLDYVGIIYIDFYDLVANIEVHKYISIPLCKEIIIDDDVSSYVHFQNKDIYTNIIKNNKTLHHLLKWDEVDVDLYSDIIDESLNILTPWSDKLFHYTSKQFPLSSQGYINIRDNKYDVAKSLCFIDYGRGVWEREKSWYWLIGVLKKDNETVALNLGSKLSSDFKINENCISINNKIYKIDTDIIFERIKKNNWSIRSKEGNSINLVFKTKNKNLNKNVIFKSSTNQRVGEISGYIIINEREIIFDKMLCWFEDNYIKW